MKKKYGKQAEIAIKKAGGMPVVADALIEEMPRLDRLRAYQRVQKWKLNGVSESGASLLERLSGVPREKLRPDIFGRK